MAVSRYLVLALLPATAIVARGATALQAPATLPIAFVKSVDAATARAGDSVEAVTLQSVKLGSSTIPSGSRVEGHVLAAQRFSHDKTPYAHQQPGVLTVRFDDVMVDGQPLPLRVTVRALASPIETWHTEDAASTDLDPQGTRTQIGGDQLIPSQAEVRSRDGDVVAYSRRDGVYAHLIARGGCDGSSQEVSVAMFSASACGAYGFGDVVAGERGSGANPSTLSLTSTHSSPQIWKHSTALLEVLQGDAVTASR